MSQEMISTEISEGTQIMDLIGMTELQALIFGILNLLNVLNVEMYIPEFHQFNPSSV